MNEIYFDNGATTKPTEEVIRRMTEVLAEAYGNPSSLHRKGQEAEKYLAESRNTIARALKVPAETIYFTSCATEASNTAIFGAAHRGGGRKHILTARGEHPATSEPLKKLAAEGYEIEYINLDQTGRILIDDLKARLREDTTLVTLMHVNNETGLIQPVDQIGAFIHEKAPRALFHVDAVQSFGKLPIDPSGWNIDLMSTSAHKIHGPKGVGFLYMGKQVHIPDMILGGGQERRFRSGTENMPGIAGYGEAVREAYEGMPEHAARMQKLKMQFYDGLRELFPDITVNGPDPGNGAPHVINVRIPGIRSEVLLHALEEEGIYISSGSACASNKPEEKSPALDALGLPPAAIDESVRFSFCRMNTEDEVLRCLDVMSTLVPKLRFYMSMSKKRR